MRRALALLSATLPLVGVAAPDPWFTGSMDDGVTLYAATINQDGLFLMQLCVITSTTCTWQVMVDVGCDKTDKATPAILSGTDGAGAVGLQCLGRAKKDFNGRAMYQYGFAPFAAASRRRQRLLCE